MTSLPPDVKTDLREENARLRAELRAALARQTATSDILRVISQSPTDVQPVFDVIVERAVRLCGARMGRVYRYDGNLIHLVGGHGLSVPGRDTAQQPFPRAAADDTIVGRVMLSRRPNTLADLNEDETVPALSRQMIEALGARSQVTMPMLLADEPIGAITLSWAEPRGYNDQTIMLLQTFADQAVIAIENVRLFNETREALERQTATADILQIIASSPSDVQPVFDAVAERAMSLLDCWSVLVTRFDGEHVHFGAARGALPDTEKFVRQRYPVRPNRETSLLGRSLLERTVVSSPDVQAEADPQLREYARKRGFHGELVVPLLRDDKVEGALVLTRAEPGLFAPREIELVQTFADQAVIAIQNARLFNETKEALERQTATADILKVIASSPSDLQPVFEAIAERSKRLVDALSTTVFRLVDGVMHLRAFTSTNPEADATLKAMFPAPLSNFSWGEAVSKGEIFRVVDTEQEIDALRDVARLRGFRSMLLVPLLRGRTPIGLISVTRVEPGPFVEHHVQLLQTFADQAVIAIENVRLFDEVRAKTRDLTEALQQQTATADVLKVISRSVFDLQTVLDTLVESAYRLCGARLGLLYLRGDEAFECRAVAGEGVAEASLLFKGRPIRAGRGTAAERVIMTGEVHSVTDFLTDPDLDPKVMELIRNASPDSGFAELRSTLAVPMTRDGVVIGVMVIARTQTGQFPARQVELLQTFADQAVIAIENARLFDEVQARTRELSRSLDDLRAAQDRLIQTEKLASLGQLTAGIAHEIKNPLNFVNNFAALSAELTDELNDLLKSAALAEKTREEVDELTSMLKDNLEKVVQHGKRADSIVKNMLLHSREGSGEHRPADINALLEESLNLAYHGARAEKPQFNVTLRRDFDQTAGMIDVFPQEITRVFLNLISNGFYAVTKRKAENRNSGFEPIVSAATKNLGHAVEIRIRDNGTGIPPEIKEKMFNPFFTTKPAGEGTGLGLSMSHDIIVKQHGGRIDVETEPGKFTEFTIVLPRTNNPANKTD
jgi:GAF domain-containing protein